jgi:hypothetical protein
MPPLLWSNSQGNFWGWNTGTAASGPTLKYALFFLAYNGTAGYIQTTNTYSYTALTQVVNFGQAMPSHIITQSAAAGNTEKGVFARGYFAIYTYSTNSVVYGTSSIPIGDIPSYGGGAAGNATEAIFAYGEAWNGSAEVASTRTWTYTYSGDTWAASANLLQPAKFAAATGTSTEAMIVVGNTSYYTNTYTYAGATVAAGPTFYGYVHNNTSAGNSSIGVFSWAPAGQGAGTQLSYYTYTAGTWTATNPLLVAARSGMGAANSAFGIIASGNNTNSTASFDFTSYAVTAGQNLTAESNYGCATSTSNTGVIS